MKKDALRRATLQTTAVRALFGSGMTVPLLAMNGLAKGYLRVLWLGTAVRHGVLALLHAQPRDAEGLASALAIPGDAVDALSSWLELGVTTGLLRREGTRFSLRGIAKPLALASNDAVAAFYTELTDVHHPLVTQAIDRLREGRPFTVAESDAELIARTSRMSEPYIAAALDQVVPRHGGVRLVEIGCGSGAHIRTAASLNPELTAVGLELQEEAASLTRRNLREWGLEGRVRIELTDAREWAGTGDADLATLHQNIYYFPRAERTDLLRHVGSFLRPGGRTLITSICRGDSHAASALDLWGALTDGADRLPTRTDVADQLVLAGYTDVEALPITPDGLYMAWTGTWPGR